MVIDVVFEVEDREDEANDREASGEEVEIAPFFENAVVLFLFLKILFPLFLFKLLAEFACAKERHALAAV